jgi:hypothetical protein
MDAARFDSWTRRRFGLAAGGLAAFLIPMAGLDTADAKKGKKKLKLNEFGCVNVGGKCRGKDSVCCSGICQGKKPKNGKKDKSRCVAHDTGGCEAGVRDGGCGGTNVSCLTSTGSTGVCETTTGNAGYCADGFVCHACRTDAECRTLCGTEAAACVQCPDCSGPGTVATGCAGPNPTDCQNLN